MPHARRPFDGTARHLTRALNVREPCGLRGTTRAFFFHALTRLQVVPRTERGCALTDRRRSGVVKGGF